MLLAEIIAPTPIGKIKMKHICVNFYLMQNEVYELIR